MMWIGKRRNNDVIQKFNSYMWSTREENSNDSILSVCNSFHNHPVLWFNSLSCNWVKFDKDRRNITNELFSPRISTINWVIWTICFLANIDRRSYRRLMTLSRCLSIYWNEFEDICHIRRLDAIDIESKYV